MIYEMKFWSDHWNQTHDLSPLTNLLFYVIVYFKVNSKLPLLSIYLFYLLGWKLINYEIKYTGDITF
jgi:hypothetical protein